MSAIEAADLVEMRRALKALVEASGLAMRTVDELAGLPAGYTAKVLGDPPIRGLSSMSIFSILGVVGYKCVLVVDETQRRRIQSHQGYVVCDDRQKRKNNHWRNTWKLSIEKESAIKRGRMGGIARREALTSEERIRIAGKAIRARWRKFKRERAQAQRAARNPRTRRNTTSVSGSLDSAPR